MMPRLVPFATDEERRTSAADVARHLRGGGWIGYPTETVYGIGCAMLAEPLRILAHAKRPGGHRPFLLLVPHGWIGPSLRWTAEARRLARSFWPGPLTLALEADPATFPPEVTAADGTVAIRDSPHPAVRAIVDALGAPITSTSANVPGEMPARDAAATAAAMRRLLASRAAWVLDGGTLPPAPPSTLVRAVAGEVRVLREGAILENEIRTALGSMNGE